MLKWWVCLRDVRVPLRYTRRQVRLVGLGKCTARLTITETWKHLLV